MSFRESYALIGCDHAPCRVELYTGLGYADASNERARRAGWECWRLAGEHRHRCPGHRTTEPAPGETEQAREAHRGALAELLARKGKSAEAIHEALAKTRKRVA